MVRNPGAATLTHPAQVLAERYLFAHRNTCLFARLRSLLEKTIKTKESENGSSS
jgi:hypothetical protein